MTKWTIPDAPSPEAIVRAALERAAYEAFEAGCGWQELRSAALSSMWPEDASKHLASEHAAFAVVDCIRSLANNPAEVVAIISAAAQLNKEQSDEEDRG